MHDAACFQFYEDEDVQRAKEQSMNDSEIAGPDVLGVVLQEGGPGLTRGSTIFGQILLNRPLADLDPQLKQLALDSFRAPQMVFPGHLPDQIDCFLGDARFSLLVLRFASPIVAEEVAMPAKQRIGLDDMQSLLPKSSAPSQENHTNAVRLSQLRSFHLAIEHSKLLSQQRVFGDQVSAAANHVGQGFFSKDGGCRFRPSLEILGQLAAQVFPGIENPCDHMAKSSRWIADCAT